jgi:hypothetical protein
MTVGELLVATFLAARAADQELLQRWRSVSYRVGSLLPNSLITVTVQRLGEIDAVCRAIEREMVAKPEVDGELDLRQPYCMMISEVWIGIAYSTCYILQHRKLLNDPDFLMLYDHLRMIRVQLEKYELPSDQHLDEPIAMIRSPLQPDEIEPPVYLYDGKDKQRAHIGRSGLSDRRSLMWEVIEVKSKASRWLERLELSDQFLSVFSAPQPDRS